MFSSSNAGAEWEKDQVIMSAMTAIMSSIDLGISSFRFADVEMSPEQLKIFESVPKEYRQNIIDDLSKEVRFSHRHENGSSVELELDLESSGTVRLFNSFPNILNALKDGVVLIIDEIERSYHFHVLELIIKIFNDPELNIHNSQLLFSTHAFHVVKSCFMRKDQVWLSEKKSGVTEYTSLEQFDSSLRDSSPFEKWYDEGRLGGIPSIDYKAISNTLKTINNISI